MLLLLQLTPVPGVLLAGFVLAASALKPFFPSSELAVLAVEWLHDAVLALLASSQLLLYNIGKITLLAIDGDDKSVLFPLLALPYERAANLDSCGPKVLAVFCAKICSFLLLLLLFAFGTIAETGNIESIVVV